jgi:hypothetical protein
MQNLVWRLIAAPEGVAQGAADLALAGELASEDLRPFVSDDDRLSAVEHLDIYADMYFYRLYDCLSEDFPKLSRRLGGARWNNLATDYLLAHPPSHFSLRELGRALPDFISGHPLGAAFSCLADLARLEWARVDVFDESDVAPLTRENLLAADFGDPEARSLGLVPASRLLGLDRSVVSSWKQLDELEDVPSGLDAAGEVGVVLVWRKGFAIWHRSVERDEARCLDALADGSATLPRLGELLLEAGPAGDDPNRCAERLAMLLQGWLADELIRSF